MRRSAGLVASMTLLCLASASSALALTMYSDRASWELAVGSWLPVDDTQISLDSGNSSLNLPAGTLTFTGPGYPPGLLTVLLGLQISATGNFAPWSGSSTPRVLWAYWGDPDIVGIFDSSVEAFGLEMKPAAGPRSLTLDLGGGLALTQEVGPEALFFGWAGGTVASMRMYADGQVKGLGFAFGRMVVAEPAAGVIEPVPEPRTLILLGSGLVLAGGVIRSRRRRR